jgi:hypothetical protein
MLFVLSSSVSVVARVVVVVARSTRARCVVVVVVVIARLLRARALAGAPRATPRRAPIVIIARDVRAPFARRRVRRGARRSRRWITLAPRASVKSLDVATTRGTRARGDAERARERRGWCARTMRVERRARCALATRARARREMIASNERMRDDAFDALTTTR